MTDLASMQPTVRLLASLLPPSWSTRAAALRAAARLDQQRGGDGLAALLDAYDRWRRQGQLPPAGPLLDLIAELAHVLGGVAHELRRRPRAAGSGNQATKTPPPTGWACNQGTLDEAIDYGSKLG